jgi:hypothetical protein
MSERSMTDLHTTQLNTPEHSYPTVGEAVARLWERLPSFWKALISAIGALFIVLVPANAFISTQFFNISRDNVRAQHQTILTEVSDQIDQVINMQTQNLITLANSPEVQACAATGCTEAAKDVFGAQLSSVSPTLNVQYTELGFLDLAGRETARAIRGIGGTVNVPGAETLYTADSKMLARLQPNEVYIFAITRDNRIAVNDSYQMPILRMALPVTVNDQRVGYVTSVLNLDDFFAQTFVYSDQYELLLLDAAQCPVASSDDTRRSELYRTWASDPTRVCYDNLSLQDWDVTAQQNGDDILSSRVMHGALTPSGQTWTLLLNQPAATAYAQANLLQALLALAHITTAVVVTVLIFLGDRATKRLQVADKVRLAAHARDTRFNPFTFNLPVDDPKRFFGRTRLFAQVIGVGVLGGSNVIVSGDPQSGKTSFLRRIEQRLKAQQIKDPHYYFWPVWMDVQGVPVEMFYRVLMELILRGVENHETRTGLRYHKNPPTYGVRQFREDVNEIIALPDSGQKEKRMVLCLDNVHYWFSEEDGSEGFTTGFRDEFRDVFNDVGSQLRVIATGTNLPRNAFGALDAYVHLGSLEVDEAKRLITQPIEDYYTIEDAALDQLLVFSDRMPAEVQRLARHAVQLMLEQDAHHITVAHADQAVERALVDWEPVYRSLWYGGSSPTQRTIKPLSEDERAALKNALNYKGVVAVLTKPASRYAGAVYTDPDGILRLTRLFSVWLSRLG